MNQNIVLAQNGSVYSDYESVLPSVGWCTPSLLNFSACVDASAAGGVVTLQITLRTPFGNYSKSFNVNTNTCFHWNLPIKLGPSLEICVSNLTTGPRVSFTLSLKLCVNMPVIGNRCAQWSHSFTLPFANEAMLRSANVSTDDLATLYVLLAQDAGDDEQSCKCH